MLFCQTAGSNLLKLEIFVFDKISPEIVGWRKYCDVSSRWTDQSVLTPEEKKEEKWKEYVR